MLVQLERLHPLSLWPNWSQSPLSIVIYILSREAHWSIFSGAKFLPNICCPCFPQIEDTGVAWLDRTLKSVFPRYIMYLTVGRKVWFHPFIRSYRTAWVSSRRGSWLFWGRWFKREEKKEDRKPHRSCWARPQCLCSILYDTVAITTLISPEISNQIQFINSEEKQILSFKGWGKQRIHDHRESLLL